MTTITLGLPRACAKHVAEGKERLRASRRPSDPGAEPRVRFLIVGSFIGDLFDARSRPAGARRTVPPGVCAGTPAGGPAPGAPRTGPPVRRGLLAGRTA